MNLIDTYLDTVVFNISQLFGSRLGICEVHPGLLETHERDDLKIHSPAIYTTLLEVSKMDSVETGESELHTKPLSYILMYGMSAIERDHTARSIAFDLMLHLDSQRWGLDFSHPCEEVDSFDLYAVSQSPDKVIGDQGWNPSLQARAVDLFGEIPIGDDPKFAIWVVRWLQRLRLGEAVY
jgi:hypothetical protein